MRNPELSVNLSKYTTLGVGGKADFLATTSNHADLVAALTWAKNENIPFLVLGGGSNVLISDTGFRGLVVINHAGECNLTGAILSVDSGANFGKIARETLNENLVGLHFGAGIPGTIGGAIAGNAGALGWDISKTLKSAEVWINGEVETWDAADFEFEYRKSKLKGKNDAVILSAVFDLLPGNTDELLGIINEDRERRAASYLGRTCGSYFKNPDGKSAGELIDKLGLKGYQIGGAEISPLHANVLRNVGDATAKDFIELENYIINKVKKAYGIMLEVEVTKIGL